MPVARLPTVSLNYLRFPSRTDTPPGGDLVLIHGLAASLGFWQLGIVRPLSWLCRLTTYDLRGHGRSEIPATGYSIPQMADDLAALLDQLGLERVHLLGHSFGGAIALLFASRHPERVRSVILADARLRALQPYHRLRDWNDWPRWQPILRRAGIELNESEPEGGYELLVAMARAQSRETSALALPLFPPSAAGVRGNGTAQRWLRLQEATSIRQDLRLPDGLTPAVLRAIRPPVLGLYGENSPVLPTGRALRRLCPHYDLQLVRNAGHFFPLTRPRRLAHASLRFLVAQTGLPIRFEQLFDGPDHEHEPQPLLATL
ncbi:MAG TPA: alpha/beta hydrolase [Xanthomonadaceae bacterium]|nr:alpha/beta hydrolase [Xanthomonadaceae bacterium]